MQNFRAIEILLQKAIALAAQAHRGHKDSLGKPYFYHPYRVMLACEVDDYSARCVAILHDVLEHTELTADELAQKGIPQAIVHKVELLSRTSGEDYFEYIETCKTDEQVRAIKLLDLQDKFETLKKVGAVSEAELLNYQKYAKAIVLLR